MLQKLCNYDWVPVPLVYSQVVFFSVRVYFILCLVARQSFKRHEITGAETAANPFAHMEITTYYLPFMTLIQLVIYMAWLKVAEVLLNPFGEDDDDFECDYMIDRNIAVAMQLVDRCHDTQGEMVEDRFGDMQEGPLYSEEASHAHQHPLMGSAAKLEAKGHLPSPSGTVRMVPRALSEEVLTVAEASGSEPAVNGRRKFASGRVSSSASKVIWRNLSSRVRNVLSVRSKCEVAPTSDRVVKRGQEPPIRP